MYLFGHRPAATECISVLQIVCILMVFIAANGVQIAKESVSFQAAAGIMKRLLVFAGRPNEGAVSLTWE